MQIKIVNLSWSWNITQLLIAQAYVASYEQHKASSLIACDLFVKEAQSFSSVPSSPCANAGHKATASLNPCSNLKVLPARSSRKRPFVFPYCRTKKTRPGEQSVIFPRKRFERVSRVSCVVFQRPFWRRWLPHVLHEGGKLLHRTVACSG